MLAGVAAAQHAVFTRMQATACGVGERMIDRRLSSGVWERLYPGVYRVGGSPATWQQSLMAACLAWGSGAVVSHRAAAALWCLPGFAHGRIELIVPRKRERAYAHSVHRPTSLVGVDVTEVDGIPVTTVARTLIDIAGSGQASIVEEALDDALRRGLVTLSRLQRRLQETRGPGRRGTRVLADLVGARASISAVPQSVFETRLLRVLRAAGVPVPAVQHEIWTHLGPAVVDLAYVERRVAIEADGYRWHSSRRRWDHDRARRNALTMLGWTIIHVTWPQLRDRPSEVIDAIRATLATTT